MDPQHWNKERQRKVDAKNRPRERNDTLGMGTARHFPTKRQEETLFEGWREGKIEGKSTWGKEPGSSQDSPNEVIQERENWNHLNGQVLQNPKE